MGLWDFLFGKDVPAEKGRIPIMSPEQEALYNRLIRQTTEGVERPITPYAGQLTTTMPSAAALILKGEPVFNVLPTAWEDYFQQAVYRPARTMFERETLPQTRAAYAGPGTYWGSERAKGEQRAIETFAEQLGATRANLALQAQREATQGILGLTPLELQRQAGDIARQYAEFQRLTPDWLTMAQQLAATKTFEPYVTQPYRRQGLVETLAESIGKIVAARMMKT